MKIIHTTSWYFPDSSGGVEVYIDALIRQLQNFGIQGQVAAPRQGTQEESYFYNQIEVYRYPVFPNATKAQTREQVLHGGFSRFVNWLNTYSADIYHQHSWRFGCGLHHLQIAKQLGMKTVVTVHMPEPVCLRGTMMQFGLQPCDGLIDEVRCGYCVGVPAKVPPAAIRVLQHLPMSVSTALETQLLASESVRVRQLGRALGLPALVSYHRHKLLEMADLADVIVVVSQWQYNAFVSNGIPTQKLRLCRLASSVSEQKPIHLQKRGAALKVGFLGRWQETKGVQTLVDAVHQMPAEIPIELVIHGMLHGDAGKENRDRVLAIAAQDPRIRVAPKLSREEVPVALASFDLLAVPSQWLETGPLVVLEAQAVGTPVIGSNLGGIAELVAHGVDGWLVPATDIQAWQEALIYLATHPDILEQLRHRIKPVRTIQDVAIEMVKLYQGL